MQVKISIENIEIHFILFSLVHGIYFPESSSHLVNGNFSDVYFLTLSEDKENIANSLQCLDTFCQVFGSAIQWHKMLYYQQSFLPSPPRVAQFERKWVTHG